MSPFQLAKHDGTTSCHREHLLSSERPLVIGSTSYHQKDLLSSERPLLVAPHVVDSHFCQTVRLYKEYILKRGSVNKKKCLSICSMTATFVANIELLNLFL